MHRLAFPALAAWLLAAGGAAAQPAPGDCARHEAAFPALVGLSEAEAVAAMERLPGIRTLRVVGPASPMTRDYRPDRATLLLREGRVERVFCG